MRHYIEVGFLREEADGKLALVNPPARREEAKEPVVARSVPGASFSAVLAAVAANSDPSTVGNTDDEIDEDVSDPDTDTGTVDGTAITSVDSGDSGPPTRCAGHIDFTFLDVKSGDHTLFLFKVSAKELAQRGLIPRLADDKVHGVQRQQRDVQIKGIVEAMRKGVPFPEGLILNLMGEQWLPMGNQLVGDDQERFHVLDGGHRQIACKQLFDAGEYDVLERYEFPATAVLRASVEVCRMLFRLQDERLHIDSGHMLALRAADGAYHNDNEKAAYALAHALNTRDDSPLKGRIRFGDRGVEGTGTELVHIGSILVMLKTIVGKKSPFAAMDPAVREQIVVDYFRAFGAVYMNFLNPEHILGQPLGLCALLIVLGNRDHRFHGEVRERRPEGATVAYTVGTMESVFKIGGRYFHWSPRKDGPAKQRNPSSLATRFHEFLADRAGRA